MAAELIGRIDLCAREVDESALHVGANQFGAEPVADVEALLALSEKSFDVRLHNANEC